MQFGLTLRAALWRFAVQGAGLLLAFHIGVAAYAQHHFHLDGDAAAFSGASGGAVVAALTAVGIPASRAQGLNLAMVSRAKQRRFGPLYHGLSDLEQLLLQEMPSDEAVRRATRGRRLCISLTSLPLLQNTLLERHESRADLARAVVCSMNLPLFLCPAQPLNGRLYIDGGISNNTPRGELRNAVTVSPRTGGGDICPRRNFDARHFFVPGDAGFMRALEEAGWQAAADAHDLLCAKGFRENGARVEAPPQHDDVQLPVSWASA